MSASKFDEKIKLNNMETCEDDSTPLESIDSTITKVPEALSKQVQRGQNTYSQKVREVNFNYRTAPKYPKRFKSSYIIFFTENRERIQLELGENANDSELCKRALELWKSMSIEQRDVWQNEALQEKERFETEKSICKDFWRFTSKRANKDPNASKKPIS